MSGNRSALRCVILFVTPLHSWPWVQAQAARAAEDWHRCVSRPLPSGARYSPGEQRKRERAYDVCLHTVEKHLDRIPHTEADRITFERRFKSTFARFAATALDLHADAVDLITQGFLPAGTEFARSSRRFDAALSVEEIVQACRNAWTVCGLQPLLGSRLAITPSIIGYSLLYPYTDNYLDRRDELAQHKREFCRRFARRLRGEDLRAQNGHEAAIWALVAMIEGEYPRARYPEVFDCLLAIHQAQEESIAQLRGRGVRADAEILRISLAKGGSSVLADACLARGWLSEAESQIAFDWGALLQLGDDLQDIREDLRCGSATLFTLAIAEGRPLDSLIAQLLNFSAHVGAELDGFPAGTAMLKDLLRVSWRSIIIAAVANVPEYFTAAFLSELEAASPFRFGFLAERRHSLAARRGLFARTFSALVDGPQESPVARSFRRPLVEAGAPY